MDQLFTKPGTAWITGGGSGIGRALALRLARAGWQVVVSGRRPEPLQETAQAAAGLAGVIHVCPLDVTDAAACQAAVAHIQEDRGPLALAVLNAGMHASMKKGTFDPAVPARNMQVNYLGVVNGLAAVLPDMKARRRGRVCIVASVAGYRGLPDVSGYGPSKAALINLAESLYLDLEPHGIGVTLVNPGFVATPMTERNRFPMPALTTVEIAAERIWQGLRQGRFEITFPRRLTWTLKLVRCLPYKLYFVLGRVLARHA